MPQTQVSECSVEMISSLISICDLLAVTHRTFYRWLKFADIKPPSRKNGMIPAQDLDNFATFYIATKILGMTLNHYYEKVVPRSSLPPISGLEGEKEVDHLFGLESYYRQVYKVDLYVFLMKKLDPSLDQIPLFAKNIIMRLKLEHEYTTTV